MGDLLQSVLDEIPEPFFRRIDEEMTASAAEAFRHASRTPRDDPTFAFRLGDDRFHGRVEALSKIARELQGLGTGLSFPRVCSFHYPCVEIGRFRILHCKVDYWGGPIEHKDYKEELAELNPPDRRQMSLFDSADELVLGERILAFVVVLYGAPGEDESVPRAIGFGVPTADLGTWTMLSTLDELYARYAAAPEAVVDRARPRLKTPADKKKLGRDSGRRDR